MTHDASREDEVVEGPLVDHHCHGLVLHDLDRDDFEGLLNESPGRSPLGTSVFDSMIGLAVRRWCAPLLGLPPLVDADTYLRRRRELGPAKVAGRLLAATGTSTYVVDTGFEPGLVCSPEQLVELGGGRAREIVRLEVLAESLLDSGVTPGDFCDRTREALHDHAGRPEVVGFKSIAAYRVGLRLPAAPPADAAVAKALAETGPGGEGHRIAHPVVNAWLAWAGISEGLPVQFHVGYGDRDLDLAECDPLHLTAFLRATEDHGVPVLLLHNYPFQRHAAYLAQVFDHVFMDVGLATHNTGALSATLLREAFELAPFGKLLYSSDAFGLAELYLLAAHFFRRALSGLLGDLVGAGEMTETDATGVVDLVCHRNASRLYRLEHG